jgi:hypothetical protein
LEAQPFARQDFFGDRQQASVFDLEVFRKHTHRLILLGRRRICNWPRTRQFHRHSESGTTLAGGTIIKPA